MKDRIEKIVRGELNMDRQVESVSKLHGDASYRTYHRVYLDDGTTLIAMQMPEGRSSASEEITNYKGHHDELPFINIAKYLHSIGLSVPKILRYNDADKLMLLDDLGDRLLASDIASKDRAYVLKAYERAVGLLAKLQNAAKSSTSNDCVALKRSFDATLLNWEFDHFREYLIEQRTGRRLSDRDRKIFDSHTRALTKEIEAMEYGFTHRDFQSRNIILRGDELYLIDFQDALKGPYVYDLVALLRDSYVKLGDEDIETLIARYSELVERRPKDVRRDFDTVTVQRKMKDAGRFVYIEKVKGNPNYLGFIPASLEYARAALARMPKHAELYDMLKEYVPEWKI